jgi:hypothetical protein
MAVGRISGQVLKAALYRDGFDIKLGNTASDVALTYFDVNNNRLGINNETPAYTMDVTGNAHVSNSIETLEIDVGDLLLNTNTIKSTAGNINLLAGSTADFITLDGNVDVTNNLVVENDITATNGTVISNTAEIAGMNMFQDSAGDQFFTTDAGPLILQPFEGQEIQLDAAEIVIPNGRTFKILDANGKTVFEIDGSNDGLVTSEQMQIDDVFIHDNVVEVNVEDQDFILKAGNPSSAAAEDPQIIMQSEVTILRDLKVEGADAKVIIDQELELNADTEASIEAYTGNLNLRVNNLGDSTVNTINLYGSVNSYGYFYIDHDLTVANTVETHEVITNNLNTVHSDKTIYVYDNLNVVDSVDADRLIINDIRIDNNRIRNEESGSDLLIDAYLNDVVVRPNMRVEDSITVPTLNSTLTIEGVNMNIDDVNIDNNTIKSTIGDLNIFADSGVINFTSNLEVIGNIHATGSIVADGDLVLGDANTDNITFNADINSNILPDIDSNGTEGVNYGNTGYTFGSTDKYWKDIYSRRITLNGYSVQDINNDHETYLDNPESEVPTTGADARLITEGGMIRFFFDNLAFNEGSNIALGNPDDSTYDDGAFFRSATISQDNFETNSDLRIEDKLDEITSTVDIAQSIDLLNEAMNNIRNNTFIRSVDYTATPLALGSGQVVTLNLDVDGTWNRVEVDWDVGRRFAELEAQIPGYNRPAESHDYVRTGNNLASVSFTYDAPLGGLFSVKVVVRNTNAQVPGSAGTDTEEVKIDYITVYTPDPVADFDFFRTQTPGTGTALSGGNLWVVEGQGLYLENFTSNTAGLFPNEATYEINWGDGTPNDLIGTVDVDGITILVNGDPLAGGGGKEVLDGAGQTVGADAPRLLHQYPEGSQTGTGSTPVTLILTAHNTADPAVIAAGVDITKNLKVYENDPVDPQRLDTKTISFAGTGTNGPTGTSPKLCASATIITPNFTVSAGDDVNRTTKTSGDIESTTITSFAYADTGIESDYDAADPLTHPTLTAIYNGAPDGVYTFTAGRVSSGGRQDTIRVTQEEDYNLLNANGTSTSFATSIFYPDAFTGYKMKLVKDASTVAVGLNSFRADHESTVGIRSSNEIEFVLDDLTVTPTITNKGTVIAGNNGTYRYISGVPYYNSGSPTIVITGMTVSNFTGQTYGNFSNPLSVFSGDNLSGAGSQSSINTQNYTYTNMTIPGDPIANGSGIPFANRGISSPHAVKDITVALTTSNVRTVERIKYRAKNVNGDGSTVQNDQYIAIHTTNQYGVNEIATTVSNTLGNGVYTDDATRIFDFASNPVDNPAYVNSTNFYTNDTYTEASDPGVQGTQEATIRFGILEHNTTDFTTFLPPGPDRTGDTGSQYATFAFRRQVVANFSISIAASGIEGIWIAAPGTATDNTSSINGWLDCSTQYNGAGVPGAGVGGNESDGVAITGADVIPLNTSISGSFDMTLGSENLSNATNNVCMVRIKLGAGQSITSLSIGVA